MSRLEEIKRLWEENNDFPVDPAEYEWLISRVEELEERNYRYRRRLKNIRLMCASEDAYDRETIPSIHEEATKAIRGDWGETE